MAKKAVLGQLLKRLPKAVGAPPEPPAYFDGAEIEDDLSGVIDAEQGSYTVDTSTGEITEGQHRRTSAHGTTGSSRCVDERPF